MSMCVSTLGIVAPGGSDAIARGSKSTLRTIMGVARMALIAPMIEALAKKKEDVVGTPQVGRHIA